MNRKPNTETVIRLAAEKSEQARQRTREAIRNLQQQGKAINFSTVCAAANVSKTFLYDPRHADLAKEIRCLRELPAQRKVTVQPPRGKSESAKDAQIARLKERVQKLEQKVNMLQQENELLYGRLATGKLSRSLPGMRYKRSDLSTVDVTHSWKKLLQRQKGSGHNA